MFIRGMIPRNFTELAEAVPIDILASTPQCYMHILFSKCHDAMISIVIAQTCLNLPPKFISNIVTVPLLLPPTTRRGLPLGLSSAATYL